jgi:hypothetical protein
MGSSRSSIVPSSLIVELVTDLQRFVDERVVWISSSPFPPAATPTSHGHASHQRTKNDDFTHKGIGDLVRSLENILCG